jgi:arabinofuranosyltransferase
MPSFIGDKRNEMNGLSSARQKNLLYGMACLLLVVAYVVFSLTVNYVIDDAFITFRYVDNLLAGHGLVYNPGERVEGYTDFLWAVLLAGFKWLFPSVEILSIAKTLGVLFGALGIVLVCGFSRMIYGRASAWGLVAGALLASNAGFAAWGTGGLETVLFAFLVLAGAFAYVRYLQQDRGFLLSPLLFALATLTRPDGVVFFGITSLFALVQEWRKRGVRSLQRMSAWSAVFLSVFGPYFVWRYQYYGYLLPNTFYTKVGSGLSQYLRGLRYVWHYSETYGAFLLIPVLAFLLLVPKRAAWRDYLFLLVGGFGLYVVYVGGDGLGFYRFIVPVVPLICLLAQDGAIELHRWITGHFGLTPAKAALLMQPAILLLLAMSMRQGVLPLVVPEHGRWYEPQSELSFPGLGKDHSYVWFDNYFVDRLKTAAKWLQANAPRNAVVAATPAGAITYKLELPVIDMLGLNDVHIAHVEVPDAGRGRPGHEKGDGKYVLSRRPDFILLGNVAVLPRPLNEQEIRQNLTLRSEHEIWADPSFHRDYELVSVHLSDRGVFRYFTFYKRKDVVLEHGPAVQSLTRSADPESRRKLNPH